MEEERLKKIIDEGRDHFSIQRSYRESVNNSARESNMPKANLERGVKLDLAKIQNNSGQKTTFNKSSQNNQVVTIETPLSLNLL